MAGAGPVGTGVAAVAASRQDFKTVSVSTGLGRLMAKCSCNSTRRPHGPHLAGPAPQPPSVSSAAALRPRAAPWALRLARPPPHLQATTGRGKGWLSRTQADAANEGRQGRRGTDWAPHPGHWLTCRQAGKPRLAGCLAGILVRIIVVGHRAHLHKETSTKRCTFR